MSKRKEPSGGFSKYQRGNVKRRRIEPVVTRSELRLLRNKNRMELKGMDTIFPTTPAGTAGYLATTTTNGDILVANLIRSGNASYNRVGKMVTLKSLRITGSFQGYVKNTTGQVYSNRLRMVVVYDAQPSSGAIPTYDVMFGRTDQAGTEDSRITDPIRYDNVTRFRIIKDCTYVFNAMAAGEDQDVQVVNTFVDEYIKLPDLKTVFSGQSSPMTIADISSGSLYIVFRANLDSNTTSYVVPDDMACRLRYYD